MLKRCALIIVILCSLGTIPIGTALDHEEEVRPETGSVDIQEKVVLSSKGTKYTVRFYRGNSTAQILAENPTKKEIDGGFILEIDGQDWVEPTLNISPGESWSSKWNLTRGLNVVQKRHTFTFSTWGVGRANYTTFNFTQDINTSDPGPIPTPEITDVEITNGTIDGEPSTVANVTITNPGIQLYGTKLMVHTLGTDGSFYGASVPPGESITITVELLDEQNAKIAGEARLYVHNLSKQDGAIDQVGFAGKVGEDTQIWNESYEPVRAPWRENSYQYTNESIEQEGPFERYTILGVPVVYVALALVALFVVFRKIR